jgi:hypothetical protein
MRTEDGCTHVCVSLCIYRMRVCDKIEKRGFMIFLVLACEYKRCTDVCVFVCEN